MKLRTTIKLMVAAVILAVAVFAVFGCGSGDSPTAAVEDFMKASQDKDCEKAVELLDLSGIEEMLTATGMSADDMKQSLIDECKASTDESEIVDYKVSNEQLEGEDKATVDVEATTKANDEESTDSQTFHLVKVDGTWKIDIANSAGL